MYCIMFTSLHVDIETLVRLSLPGRRDCSQIRLLGRARLTNMHQHTGTTKK